MALHVQSQESCNRAQFWGAVGIFVEKPHLLNRRLCGVSDIWWGAAESASGLLSLQDSDEVVTTPGDNHVPSALEGDSASSDQHACAQKDNCGEENVTSGSTSSQDETKEIGTNLSNEGMNCREASTAIDNLILRVELLLNGDNSPKCNHVTGTPNVAEENDGFPEENLVEQLKSLLKSGGLSDVSIEQGERFQPWSTLCKNLQQQQLFVVIRRAIPKQIHRFSTTIEVIFLDGSRDRCSILSRITSPPLLPCCPYHLQHNTDRISLRVPHTHTTDKIVTFYNGVINTSSKNDITIPTSNDNNNPTVNDNTIPTSNNISIPTNNDDSTTISQDTATNDNMISNSNGVIGKNTTNTSIGNNRIVGQPPRNRTSVCGNEEKEDTGVAEDTAITDGHRSTFVTSGLSWLQDTVLPRLAKWSTQVSVTGETEGSSSLCKVDLQAYSALYSKLKQKYASKLVQSWQERTDPHKFVHEDIGIATYILLLWGRLPRRQRFLDLGCGNGLLVYILTSEGHSGQGLDIKKRNIWDTFPPNIDLQEKEVRPCDGFVSSDVDWLLGNHSDELTPWIPVMAARASYTCNFWVLPCCAHDFTAKFLRRNSGVSQYSDYLNYVEDIGKVCGFQMDRDRLKIPSTKRVCFSGQTRTYTLEEWPLVLEKIQKFIDSRVAAYINNQQLKTSTEITSVDCGKTDSEVPSTIQGSFQPSTISSTNKNNNSIVQSNTTDNYSHPQHLNNSTCTINDDRYTNICGDNKNEELWSSHFVARSKEQRVRNCTQLKPGVKEELVSAVVAIILNTGMQQSCESWSSGRKTQLSDVAQQLGSRRLQQLKQECGGLQTLLRNHRHIFLVEHATVKLRSPGRVDEEQKRHRACWFNIHHPQGCPNAPAECIYDHNTSNS
uniref:Probable tRNA (uracil-O(2)-)-methyltransferase n=1 Tax=Hirondellea gigas TaxID=1518452 RepID=A0A6A7FTM7_9CRUS